MDAMKGQCSRQLALQQPVSAMKKEDLMGMSMYVCSLDAKLDSFTAPLMNEVATAVVSLNPDNSAFHI